MSRFFFKSRCEPESHQGFASEVGVAEAEALVRRDLCRAREKLFLRGDVPGGARSAEGQRPENDCGPFATAAGWRSLGRRVLGEDGIQSPEGYHGLSSTVVEDWGASGGPALESALRVLGDVARERGIRVLFAEAREGESALPHGVAGAWVPEAQAILLRERMPEPLTAFCLAHELAHAVTWPAEAGGERPQVQLEVIADLTALVVLRTLGVEQDLSLLREDSLRQTATGEAAQCLGAAAEVTHELLGSRPKPE